MAVSSSVQPPILSYLLHLNSSNNLSSSRPNLSLFGVTSRIANRRRPSLIAFSSKSNNALSTDKKREFLERYGLNPDELLSKPSPKGKRRKELQKTDRVKQVPLEEPRPPRETHRLLQVLGGTARRKKLISPKGMDVRPMMEVVKGATFDILQAAGGCPASLRPGRWLDLYSGTGSVGIEALSRGCSKVHFVEMDPWVVSDVLRPNLEWTGFLDASVIHTVRVENFLERADRFEAGPFDYVSVTPPYTEVDYAVLMDQISKSSLVGEDTFIVCWRIVPSLLSIILCTFSTILSTVFNFTFEVVEYPLRARSMLDSCGCLIKIADRRFGRTHLAIYGPKWAQKKRKSEKSVR